MVKHLGGSALAALFAVAPILFASSVSFLRGEAWPVSRRGAPFAP